MHALNTPDLIEIAARVKELGSLCEFCHEQRSHYAGIDDESCAQTARAYKAIISRISTQIIELEETLVRAA